MTVFIAAKHAWMPTYCTACENIVHFQKDDVKQTVFDIATPEQVMAGARGSPRIGFYIECRCGHHIVVTTQ